MNVKIIIFAFFHFTCLVLVMQMNSIINGGLLIHNIQDNTNRILGYISQGLIIIFSVSWFFHVLYLMYIFTLWMRYKQSKQDLLEYEHVYGANNLGHTTILVIDKKTYNKGRCKLCYKKHNSFIDCEQ